MLYVLILLFVFNGQVMFEKSTYETMDKCIAAFEKRSQEQYKDPRFDGGLFAQCIQVEGQTVKK